RISSYAQQAEGLPRNVVHEMVAGAVDFIVFISRDRRGGGRRRIRSILEVNGYDDRIGVASSEVFAPNENGEAARVPNVAIERADSLVAAGWQPATPEWGWTP